MASIGATLELYDRMTTPLEHIIASVDSLTRAFAAADTASDSIGITALENARVEAEGACAALETLRSTASHIPAPEPVRVSVVWEETNLPVFSGSDAERYALEVADVNERLTVLAQTQARIAGAADGTQVFSSAAATRISDMTARIDDIRQKVSAISQNRLNIASPGANAQLETMRAKLLAVAGEQERLNSAVGAMDFSAANAAYNSMQQTLDDIERQIRDNTDAQGAFNDAVKEGGNSADGLLGKLKGLAGAYIGIQGVQKLIGFADDITQINARLDMVNELNGELETTDVLNDKIFASAARARASYETTADAVAKMGIMAHDAFGSNDELIAFTELINKQFAIAGTSAQGIDAAMLQLTQAMSSGVLRGEELNSVFEQAPTIIQTIAEYLGKPVGEIRDLAAEGKITADVVKNAMLASADEINGKFESMPYTFSQVWTMAITSVQQALMPLIRAIGSVANFVAKNWDIIAPIIMGIATAVGILTAAVVIYNAVQTITNGIKAVSIAAEAIHAGATLAQAAATETATGAQIGLNAALLACPLTWVVLAVIAVIAIFYAVIGVINKFAGTSISATGIICGALAVGAAYIGNLFVSVINFVIDIFGSLHNYIAAFANFFANVFDDPIGSIARLFFDLADIVLGVLQALASAIDTIFGSNLAGALGGWRDSLGGWVDSTFGKGTEVMAKMSTEDMHLGRFEYGEAWNFGYGAGASLGNNAKSGFDDIFNYGDMAADIGEINDTTGGMAKDLECSEENLKYLRDIAERDVINKFTTSAVTVNLGGVTNNVASGFDLDGIVVGLGERLAEEVYVASEGVHA